MFELSQGELEKLLFRYLESAGYGQFEINRFKMVNQFHQSRRSLILIICGAPCAFDNVSIAQHVSSRLNLPNVLRTDALEEILRHHPDVNMKPEHEFVQAGLSASDIIYEFRKNCKIIHRAIAGDIAKVESSFGHLHAEKTAFVFGIVFELVMEYKHVSLLFHICDEFIWFVHCLCSL